MTKPVAVVTGGAGFIGSHMVDLLVARGFAVRVIDNMVGGRRENLASHEGNADLVLEERDIRSYAPDDALFLSDVHLGSGTAEADREREARLLSFLETRARRARRLFVLGDLFDFWFAYAHAIPRRHLAVVRRLAELTEAGIGVTYFGGNHDFWAGRFLEQEVGAVRALALQHRLEGFEPLAGFLRIDVRGTDAFFVGHSLESGFGWRKRGASPFSRSGAHGSPSARGYT